VYISYVLLTSLS